MDVEVKIDQTSLRRFVAAFNAESDGKELKRDLRAGFKAALAPAVELARSSIMSMDSGGLTPGRSLRSSIARAIKPSIGLTKRDVRVAIRVAKSGMPRGFENAPKRTNAVKGWRHPVFGNRQKWVAQKGKPRWFDDAMSTSYLPAKKAAQEALDAMADRIDRRTRSR